MSAVKTEEARGLLEERLTELETEATGVRNAINQIDLGTGAVNGKPKKVGRPKGSTTKRKPRRKGKGTRRDDVLKLVKSKPGIQTSAVAKKLKIKPNYLYRVVGELEKEKLLRKDGRALYAS